MAVNGGGSSGTGSSGDNHSGRHLGGSNGGYNLGIYAGSGTSREPGIGIGIGNADAGPSSSAAATSMKDDLKRYLKELSSKAALKANAEAITSGGNHNPAHAHAHAHTGSTSVFDATNTKFPSELLGNNGGGRGGFDTSRIGFSDF